jgi:hypothetical protein
MGKGKGAYMIEWIRGKIGEGNGGLVGMIEWIRGKIKGVR